MNDERELSAIARSIIDDNQYLTLGTADEDGRPWVSPVYFAAADHTEFYWISAPGSDHSRNIAGRPEVSIVVFDSRAPIFTGQAVYMSGVAAQVADADLERGLEVYPGRSGAVSFTADELRPPGRYRMYRAIVAQHWILCPRESGPCAPHGRDVDHRTSVTV